MGTMRTNKVETSKQINSKGFDDTKHRAVISQLQEHMDLREFEKACYPIVVDILKSYEGFERVEKGPKFTGTPFDFFGFKNGEPYIIEFKGSLHYFNPPRGTQKRRMQELLTKIKGLRIALLQVKLKKASIEYYMMKKWTSCLKAPKPLLSQLRNGSGIVWKNRGGVVSGVLLTLTNSLSVLGKTK